MNIFDRLQTYTDKFFKDLFANITEQHSHAHIVRFAITFLDIWQAVIIVDHNYWIPQLVDNASVPLHVYIWYACILAILAIIAFIMPDMLWISGLVLALNFITYLFLGIAGIWYSDPPKASSGFSLFVMLISISAFWRIILLILRDRAIRKRN